MDRNFGVTWIARHKDDFELIDGYAVPWEDCGWPLEGSNMFKGFV